MSYEYDYMLFFGFCQEIQVRFLKAVVIKFVVEVALISAVAFLLPKGGILDKREALAALRSVFLGNFLEEVLLQSGV